MRFPSRATRGLTGAALLLVAGFAVFVGARLSSSYLGTATARAFAGVAVGARAAAPTTTAPALVATPTTVPTPVPTPPPAPAAAPVSAPGSGDARLDALLPTLPTVLFEGGAHVHFGYNPVDCCHAGGYNPEPNDVWVSERALGSAATLTYVTVHELAHSVHLNSARGAALTAAVAGAPVVRAGPWDDSEKVADCVAWALYPAETAASGITYWGCPDPWRNQVLTALR